jgi:hypothetical protein
MSFLKDQLTENVLCLLLQCSFACMAVVIVYPLEVVRDFPTLQKLSGLFQLFSGFTVVLFWTALTQQPVQIQQLTTNLYKEFRGNFNM